MCLVVGFVTGGIIALIMAVVGLGEIAWLGAIAGFVFGLICGALAPYCSGMSIQVGRRTRLYFRF